MNKENKQIEELEKLLQFATENNFNHELVDLFYGQQRAINRKRAYQRTFEYIYLESQRRKSG